MLTRKRCWKTRNAQTSVTNGHLTHNRRSTMCFSAAAHAKVCHLVHCLIRGGHNILSCALSFYTENKCSVGPETSIPEIEKLMAKLLFPREDFSFPRSDSCQTEEKKSPLEEKEKAETFSIEDILVSCPTNTFFLPLKRHDPNQKSME